MAAVAVTLHAIVALLALVVALPATSVTAPERITFASFDVDRDGAPVALHALLFRPAGNDGRRLPAVIALHGCGGMYSTARTRRNQLSLRHQAMVELLVHEGYVVLFPDSFRSRGREAICHVPGGERSIDPVHRRLDVFGALTYLQARSDVAVDRIAVLGWSHGGSTVLASLDAGNAAVRRYREARLAAPYVRAAVAFYPGCIQSLRGRGGYAAAAPMLLLIAGSDDWTAPTPCVALVERLQARGNTADAIVYPATYHGFDGPDSQPRLHLDVPNGVHPGEGVTFAVNPAARDDAYARIRTFLRDTLSNDASKETAP